MRLSIINQLYTGLQTSDFRLRTSDFGLQTSIFRLKIVLLLIGLVFAGQIGRSQGITVNAKLDTNIIMIGDQIKFRLSVEQDRNFLVDFPMFADTIAKEVEIIERGNVDTTFLTDKMIRLEQEFTITSFDSGFHVIRAIPFPFRGKGIVDTIESRPLALGVYTFTIDSVTGIADIKPPIEAPLTFVETLPYAGGGLGLVAIIILILWLFKYFGRKEIQQVKRKIPKEPPHVIALRDLDKLVNRKLWQQGKFKEYHSELTEIVRIYIEYRFDIMAMEQTSDEIFQQFERNDLLGSEKFELLKQMLTLADYVKFAKLHPLPDENELSLKHAYDFVLKTKQKVDLTSRQSPVSSQQSPVGSSQSAVDGINQKENDIHNRQIEN
ncbi:MAG: hypothetical protein U9R19_02655 [Bacteroidota bacterium]|nr:hypothetical protein [Bacteroidota bacterium]